MFVAFERERESERFFERLRDSFKPPSIQKRKVEVSYALPFYVVRAKERRGIYPWQSAADAAGALRSRALLPFWANPDDDVKIKPFKPSEFLKRLLFNSSVETIEKMLLDPRKVSITVIDENASFVDGFESLIYFASRLNVVTDCTEPYEKLACRLLKKYGVSLLVSSRLHKGEENSTFIISNTSEPIPSNFSGVLFTNEKTRFENAVVIAGEGFTLPEKYSALLPQDADELNFAGALFELCGASELGRLRYNKMCACG